MNFSFLYSSDVEMLKGKAFLVSAIMTLSFELSKGLMLECNVMLLSYKEPQNSNQA